MVAVDLRARRDEHRLSEPGRVLENVLGPADVREQRVSRSLDDQTNADSRREVKDGVALVNELADDRGGENGLDCEVKVRISRTLEDIRVRSRREIV
jgi:hypothetical protein